ncbi:MAG: N-acetylglucosamine-6-phosphate deacetylase [Acidobacteria bacterium]|nr:N-acetylglucosamine-6-phosphate deacetylase [Acidobacteriota bacterium]MBV9625226.1 N-acetylglucosamine-6-phosphate deacetylase [Acidobacteriota bacterium]
MLALTARALYTPLARVDRPLVLIEGETILRLESQAQSDLPVQARTVDFGDCILAPGFVDIHIHGAAGIDLMQADGTGLKKIEKFLAAHGVTSYCPTTVTAPVDTTLRVLERLAGRMESREDASEPGAQPIGIHLEGPFLSHSRRGVHPRKDLLSPAISTFDRFWEAARGHISLLTIAPELEGALELIVEARKRGVVVSLGHSDADLEQTRAAVAVGARHATHTFNAMRPLDHRAPGILGEVLSNPLLTADLIADGIHVHPAIVRLFLEAKGAERAVLITDALAAAGMPDGRYWLGELEIEVKEGRCLHQGTLAGSVLTLDRALRNIMNFAQWTLERSLPAATLNPARVVGLESKGSIQAGAGADLVALSPAGEVLSTMTKGMFVQ